MLMKDTMKSYLRHPMTIVTKISKKSSIDYINEYEVNKKKLFFQNIV